MATLVDHERNDPLKEYGVVLKLESKNAVVGIKRNSACSSCGACELGSNHSQMQLTLKNTVNAKPGDIVEIELPASQFLKASTILYLIPLMSLVLGIILGYYVGVYLVLNAELIGAVTGIVFTILAYMLIRKLEPRFKENIDLNPKITEIYKGEKGESYNGKG